MSSHSIGPRALLVLALALAASCKASPVEHAVAEGALGPYSGAVRADQLVFLAGKIGSERDADFEREAETAIDALAEELQGLELDLSNVVSCTVYLTDMELYEALNEVYARRFPAPYPARACVAVAALPAGARVEIQAVARR